MYKKYIKRFLDIILSLTALIVLFPVFAMLTLIGAIKMKGNPFFVQERPGKKGKDGREKIFKLIKFRTMSNAKDKNGNLLPDDIRLNKYGKILRNTSLDEFPEAINILKGDMSIVGPRPLLVEYLQYYTMEERQRHDVRPGLTGLAQVSGRNLLTWEEKFALDIKYVKHISFLEDCRIVLCTVWKAFVKEEGISQDNMATVEPFKRNIEEKEQAV